MVDKEVINDTMNKCIEIVKTTIPRNRALSVKELVLLLEKLRDVLITKSGYSEDGSENQSA